MITWTVDTTAPTMVNCPATTLDLGCNPASIPTCASYNVTATDDCGVTNVSCASVQVTNGCIITRTLTWTAKDGCNNSASCSQVITWIADKTLPVFGNCPAPTLNAGCNPVLANIPTCASYNVTATDGCSTPSLSCASVDAANGCVHTRTLTYTAVDGCNNTNTCTQVITWVIDTTPPVFTKCPANRHLSCNPVTIPDCDTTAANVTATDDCGTPVITCSKSDSVSADLCFHDRTITYVATDSCGNSSSCIQHIFWTTDTTPPTFIKCPANIDLGLNPASIPDCDLSPSNVSAEDGCSSPIISCLRTDSTNGCNRTRTILYTATDACNNQAFCTQRITWHVPDPAPVLGIVVQGTSVVVTWPLTCNNFRLQQTSALGSPSTWTDVTQASSVVNNQNQVTIPINGQTFFRLIYP